MSDARIAGGSLSATVSTEGVHGWCGLDNLTHTNYPMNWLLSPALTLEHYIGVPMDAPDYIEYEPAQSQRSLSNVQRDGCTLRYAPHNCCEVDCAISYQIMPPHYIDVLVTVQTTRKQWPHKYLALFFATIVDVPIYTGVNILGHEPSIELSRSNPWLHFNGQGMTRGRTIHPAGVANPELTRPSNPPNTYFFDDSSIRFDQPFFYGTVDQMVFSLLFKTTDHDHLRFTVNPIAEAFGAPAWDFFWVIEDPMPGETWRLPLQVIWKPFISRQDILNEYESYNAL